MIINTLIKLYGNIIRYKCPCCGEINSYHESTIEILKESELHPPKGGCFLIQ